jgi:hypothetical protein
MLAFRRQDRPRVERGEITVTYRLWRTPKVTAGKRYPFGDGAIDVESVDVIPAALIPASDVAPSGCESIAAIRELAGEHTRTRVTADTLLYRVEFRYLPASSGGASVPPSARDGGRTRRPPARPDGTSADLPALLARLDRMDARSPRGPWTRDVLRLIQRSPQTSARLLSAKLDWERLDFKAHVRRLKRLGLTRSFEVGYELTDLGREVLAASPKPRRRRASPD